MNKVLKGNIGWQSTAAWTPSPSNANGNAPVRHMPMTPTGPRACSLTLRQTSRNFPMMGLLVESADIRSRPGCRIGNSRRSSGFDPAHRTKTARKRTVLPGPDISPGRYPQATCPPARVTKQPAARSRFCTYTLAAGRALRSVRNHLRRPGNARDCDREQRSR
jgi:hypothetical protein